MKSEKQQDPKKPEAASKTVPPEDTPKSPRNARTGRKSTQRGADTDHPIAPEALAALAAQLLRQETPPQSTRSRSGFRLASDIADADLTAALKTAQRLLQMASGKSNEKVDSYQVFTAQDGLMSFQQIADRFTEAGWKGLMSRNTVEAVVMELVRNARDKVDTKMERHDHLLAVRSGYKGGISPLVDRMKRHIRRMINHTQLHYLFDNPKKVADTMGSIFYRLMTKEIPEDWEITLEEETGAVRGVKSFIEHVCGGLSYEQFTGDQGGVWMSLEHLRLVAFFAETLASMKPAEFRSAQTTLGTLMRLVTHWNGIPAEVIENFTACEEELGKPDPDAERVKSCANRARQGFHALWECFHLDTLVRDLYLKNLISEFGCLHSELGRADPSITDKVESVLHMLQRVDGLPKAREQAIGAGEIRALLTELREGLRDPDLLGAASTVSRDAEGSLAAEMKKVAAQLTVGLRDKPLSKRDAREALNELLRELRPYSGERRCRPYELFLFAAQERLLQDKLVRKRSELKHDFFPHPPRDPSWSSILETHDGVDLLDE